jgi:hypothetical protein
VVVWPFFFKIRKQKFQFKFQKWFFSKFFILIFSCGINEFFLDPRLPNLLKDCKNYLFTLTKNSHILHTTIGGGHRKTRPHHRSSVIEWTLFFIRLECSHVRRHVPSWGPKWSPTNKLQDVVFD